MQEAQVRSLGWGDALEKEKGTHSSVLACEILWAEEHGGLQGHSVRIFLDSYGDTPVCEAAATEILITPVQR